MKDRNLPQIIDFYIDMLSDKETPKDRKEMYRAKLKDIKGAVDKALDEGRSG